MLAGRCGIFGGSWSALRCQTLAVALRGGFLPDLVAELALEILDWDSLAGDWAVVRWLFFSDEYCASLPLELFRSKVWGV